MNTKSNSKKIKVAIITNIPTPYRKKQWEYYSKCKNLDITVFYCAKIEKDRYWEVDSPVDVKEIFLSGITYKYLHFNPGILKVILQDYDIFLVGGYGYPSAILAIFALKALNKPWAMIIDGVSPLKLKKEGGMIKKFLIKGANAYFANGTIGTKFLEKYGISFEKIFNQYMTVDVEYFIDKGRNSEEIRKEIRKKYGISNNSVLIMFAGRLIYSKGVQDLIESLRILKNKGYDIKALIVGNGDFKKDLMEKSLDLNYDVYFTGHIDPKELYRYYYASDIFVLPTYDDPWGLVVNEAMSCKLPVIVTKAAGCSCDMIKDNGIIIEPDDVENLVLAIEDIIKNNKFNNFGDISRKIASKWTFKESLESFKEVINYALNE